MYYIYIFVLFITYIWTVLLCVKLKQTLTIIIKVLSPVIHIVQNDSILCPIK